MRLSNTTAAISSAGLTVQLQLFALTTSSLTTDIPILSVSGYLDLLLTNNSQSLTVNLYSSTGAVARQIVFNNYIFRYRFWSNYSITVNTTAVSLFADGTLVRSFTHSVTLPSTATNLTISNPQGLSYLISGVLVADSKFKIAFN